MQNSYTFWLAPKAKQDIDSIYDYIVDNLKAPKAACDLNEKFFAALERVALMPRSCPVVNNTLIKKDGIRKLIVENYIILYFANEAERAIEVYKVIYASSNYLNVI